MRKARIIIRARRLSRVARRRSSSEMAAGCGAAAGVASGGLASGALASARALILFARTGSAAPQLPSSTAVISPLASGGQFGRFHDGAPTEAFASVGWDAPSALFTASAPPSSRPSKKRRHSGSTLPGSVSYRAWSCSR